MTINLDYYLSDLYLSPNYGVELSPDAKEIGSCWNNGTEWVGVVTKLYILDSTILSQPSDDCLWSISFDIIILFC